VCTLGGAAAAAGVWRAREGGMLLEYLFLFCPRDHHLLLSRRPPFHILYTLATRAPYKNPLAPLGCYQHICSTHKTTRQCASFSGQKIGVLKLHHFPLHGEIFGAEYTFFYNGENSQCPTQPHFWYFF
jgi:hypothetical protein